MDSQTSYIVLSEDHLVRSRTHSNESHNTDNESHSSHDKLLGCDTQHQSPLIDTNLASDSQVEPLKSKRISELLPLIEMTLERVDECDGNQHSPSDFRDAVFIKQHPITPIPEAATMNYESEYNEIRRTNNMIQPQSINDLWKDLEKLLVQLDYMLGHKKEWVGLIINEVKKKEFGRSSAAALQRIKACVKRGYDKRLSDYYPWNLLKQERAKLDLCKDIVSIYEKIENVRPVV